MIFQFTKSLKAWYRRSLLGNPMTSSIASYIVSDRFQRLQTIATDSHKENSVFKTIEMNRIAPYVIVDL